MRKSALAAVLGLACWVAPAAQGQFQTRPQTTPFTPAGRGFSPLFGSPFGGSGFGTTPFGGGAFGPGGNPYGLPGTGGFGAAGTVAGFGTTGINPGTTALGTRSILDPTAGWVTGHPVRFQSYRSYFQNPNASLAGAGTLGDASPVFGTGQSRTSVTPGKRPARGKENLDR